MGSEELKDAIRKLGRVIKGSRVSHPPLDVTPGCAFGAIVEQRLKDMERELGEVRARLNGLIFLVIGVVIVEIVLSFTR